MTYTGMVSPGGPAAVRELDGLTIRKASVSDMDNNVYLLTCTSSGAQALVDAADDAARLLALVQEGGGGLDLVVTTHQHWDHHRALAEVLAATPARSAAGAADADALPVAPDVRLEQGDTVTFGDVTLDVLHLRGHTPGSVALAWTDDPRAGSAPVHRRLPLPGRCRQRQQRPRAVRLPARRRAGAGLRPATRRPDLGLPRPRRRHDPRGGTAARCRCGASAAGSRRHRLTGAVVPPGPVGRA